MMMITSLSNPSYHCGNTIPWIAGRSVTSTNTPWPPSRIHHISFFPEIPPIIPILESLSPLIRHQKPAPAIHITQGESQFPHSIKKPRKYGARS